MTHPCTARHTLLAPITLIFLALGSGCATPAPGTLPRKALSDSTVDITYVLGHSRRRLVAWARGESFGGQTLMDHQILRETEIDRRHYTEFFGKAEQLVTAPRRRPAAEAACRTPFTVSIRIGVKVQTLEGCRGEDDGALSRLVRDGEFLLYSKK